MRWWHYIFLPEAQAANLGFTHSGRIFGVPAWLMEAVSEDGEDVIVACPKFVPLQLYSMVMDALLWTMAYITALEFETPYTLVRPINGGSLDA